MAFGIGLGPRIFRVRVSTRGVGISSGIGPFSVWTSTRGGGRRRPSPTKPTYGPYDAAGLVPLSDVTGSGAEQLTASSSSELLEELNRLVRPPLWPWALVTTLLVSILLAQNPTRTVNWPPLIILTIGLIATAALAAFQALRKVRIDYEVDGPMNDWHAKLRNTWPQVAQVEAVWRVLLKGNTQNSFHQKVNAGAGHLVSRDRVMTTRSPHRRVASNLVIPTFRGGHHTLAFLPDRILMRSGRKWCEIDYSELSAAYQEVHFVESGSVPRDGQQVGITWQFVNKNGGPDRRFANNRQLPIMLYGEIELTTPTGLRWILQMSRPEVASVLANALRAQPALPSVNP